MRRPNWPLAPRPSPKAASAPMTAPAAALVQIERHAIAIVEAQPGIHRRGAGRLVHTERARAASPLPSLNARVGAIDRPQPRVRCNRH